MSPFWSTILTAVISSLGGGGLVSLITFFVTRADKKKEKEEANGTAQSRMLKGLAHDRICFLGECYLRRGYITKDEYENLHDYLYEPYHDLGGNGTAEKIIKEVDELPMTKKEEKA